MEPMSERIGLISSYQLLITAARWKAATPEQLTGAHLYLDISKSGYLFHAVGDAMPLGGTNAFSSDIKLNTKVDTTPKTAHL